MTRSDIQTCVGISFTFACLGFAGVVCSLFGDGDHIAAMIFGIIFAVLGSVGCALMLIYDRQQTKQHRVANAVAAKFNSNLPWVS